MTKTQQKSGKCPIFGFYHPTKEPMMCHEVQLSTDHPDDLSVNTLGIYFENTANNTDLKYTQHYHKDDFLFYDGQYVNFIAT